ncbi:MAG: hypothetical protein DWI02_10565 [Planctomycetota bacterium]|nr:MAG: hypothetical protein DWI02_10565 [Planctomycetota bacterium]
MCESGTAFAQSDFRIRFFRRLRAFLPLNSHGKSLNCNSFNKQTAWFHQEISLWIEIGFELA